MVAPPPCSGTDYAAGVVAGSVPTAENENAPAVYRAETAE